MTHYQVVFSELALEEYSQAFNYYQEQLNGLGIKFEIETETIIKAIAKNPYLFQRKHKYYREAILKKFPYFLVYEINDKTVIINSVFHTARNPKGKLKPKKK